MPAGSTTPTIEWGVASSPIIYKNLVIVQCDIQQNSFIAAFDVKTGKKVWRTPRDEIPSWGTPTILDGPAGPELVTQRHEIHSRLRPADGQGAVEAFRQLRKSRRRRRSSARADHRDQWLSCRIQPIYAIKPGARGDITPAGEATSGEFLAWSAKRGGPYLPTPVIYGDLLYIVANNGALAAYDVRTGERRYQERLGGKGGAFSASPVAADGKIYFASEDGEMFVVKAGPTYELLATNPMGEVLMATPAISDGVIFVRGMQTLFALGSPPRKTASKSRE